MPSKLVNIAIVSENVIFRKVLAHYLVSQESVYIAAQSATMETLLASVLYYRQPIHVVLVDLCGATAVQNALQAWMQAMPAVRFVMLVGKTDMPLLNRLLGGNVLAFLSKSEEPAHIIEAIEATAARKLYRNRLLTEIIFWGREEGVWESAANTTLDNRGEILLQLLWEEKSNREIADHLCLCESSVEKMKSDIRKKLGIRSSVGLLKYVILNKMK